MIEERDSSFKCFSANKIYEWKIDSQFETNILNTLQHMTMVSTAYPSIRISSPVKSIYVCVCVNLPAYEKVLTFIRCQKIDKHVFLVKMDASIIWSILFLKDSVPKSFLLTTH